MCFPIFANSFSWRSNIIVYGENCHKAQLETRGWPLENHRTGLFFPRIDDGNVSSLEVCGVAGDDARSPAIGDSGDHEI